MRTKFYLLLLLSIVLSGNAVAQELAKTLNAEQILEIVRSFHPIVKQAKIGIDKSKAELLFARGNFDPVVNAYAVQKKYDGVEYYKDISPELKIPTWYGMDIIAGLEDLSGNRLDPTQSSGQSSYVGINIPLAKNLVMDRRRAYLKQAKILNTMAEVEQRALINDLCMEAMEAYWQWVKAYQTYIVVKNNVEINEKRFDLVRKSYLHGERSAIDTTEALSQLQSFQYIQNEKWLEFQNAGIQLSAFLWKSDNQPYQLPVTITPPNNWDSEQFISKYNLILNDLLTTAGENHPNLTLYNYKLGILEIEKKLKFQDVLPKVDFRYNFLAKGFEMQNTIGANSVFQNNYQYGIKLEVPLFLSQGRANYKTAKLKLADTRLDQIQKQLQVQLKIKSYFNTYLTYKNQVALQRKNYENYQKLVKAEEVKFFNGESSLFLINSRENKALEGLEKLIETKANYLKSVYAIQWSAGLLK